MCQLRTTQSGEEAVKTYVSVQSKATCMTQSTQHKAEPVTLGDLLQQDAGTLGSLVAWNSLLSLAYTYSTYIYTYVPHFSHQCCYNHTRTYSGIINSCYLYHTHYSPSMHNTPTVRSSEQLFIVKSVLNQSADEELTDQNVSDAYHWWTSLSISLKKFSSSSDRHCPSDPKFTVQLTHRWMARLRHQATFRLTIVTCLFHLELWLSPVSDASPSWQAGRTMLSHSPLLYCHNRPVPSRAPVAKQLHTIRRRQGDAAPVSKKVQWAAVWGKIRKRG